ncbi:hypothetical protein DFH11DRAFT_1549964 [Phellopilus nigrolimitatus]|nr:hypothetical protein DFH11DRAFT_1549964 [Phellopilus nigrolimitatus]
MARIAWATYEQHVWLLERYPYFHRAYQRDTTTLFFHSLYDDWFRVFPPRPATDVELAATNYSVHAARMYQVRKTARKVVHKAYGSTLLLTSAVTSELFTCSRRDGLMGKANSLVLRGG